MIQKHDDWHEHYSLWFQPTMLSTQTFAKKLSTGKKIEPAKKYLVLCHEQKQGYGRYGRVWLGHGKLSHAKIPIEGTSGLNSKNENLGQQRLDMEISNGNFYASLLLPKQELFRQNLLKQDWSSLSLVMAVAVAKTLEPLLEKDEIIIKWPNDILLKKPDEGYGKKLAGILTEVLTDYVVIGVGINTQILPNIKQAEVMKTEMAVLRPSVKVANYPLLTRPKNLAKLLINQWEKLRMIWCNAGFAKVKPCYESLALPKNAVIQFTAPVISQQVIQKPLAQRNNFTKQKLLGYYQGVDDDGALLVILKGQTTISQFPQAEIAVTVIE